MTSVSIGLVFLSLSCGIVAFFSKRLRKFLILSALFALINSFIATPLNWLSFFKGHEFFIHPITETSPPVLQEKLALPTDTPEIIIEKMGCYVCHKIPYIANARFSDYGPLLIPKTIAHLRVTSPEYLAQVKTQKANASNAREYIQESILNPSAFIVPGYENRVTPEKSNMYHFYSLRFTKGGLDVLTDYLLSIGVEDAVSNDLIIAH